MRSGCRELAVRVWVGCGCEVLVRSGRPGLAARARPAAFGSIGVSGGLDLALLIGAAVLLVAVAAVRVSTRLGLPSLLVYLGIGMVIGEAGLGIRFDDAELTRALGFCALIVIIAEGGLTARWTSICCCTMTA